MKYTELLDTRARTRSRSTVLCIFSTTTTTTTSTTTTTTTTTIIVIINIIDFTQYYWMYNTVLYNYKIYYII